VCVLNVIYSLSCWTHHLIIYPFQAYSLIAGHFCWTFRTCSFGCKLYLFSLCLVSAPKLWIYMNSCIKTSQLYYEVDFVVNAALNSDWVRISLCVSLGSHRYGTLEGNFAYVPVMDPGFGSWQYLWWVEIKKYMDMNTNFMNFLFKEMFLILVAILTSKHIINYNLKSFLFFYYLYLVLQLKVLEKSRCYF
jgi:hypothetical protein